ncbi:MAG TPA: MOSC domain-containing protein [Candidatus Dormibacteraeota bacterium]|jgi:MOSC domain-containing protein YiiM
MQSVPSATLSAGVGLAGDKHASPASTRQVLLADKEALDRLNLESGVIKENVTVEGLDVMTLDVGTRLQLGAQVVLEITSVCEPCFRMDEIRPGLRAELDGKRGMNSRVVTGGRIAVGEAIAILAQRELAS